MTNREQSELDRLRQAIDGLNDQILDLLNQRANLVEEIGPVKQAAGQSVFDPVREARQLERLMLANKGPLPNGAIEPIFRAIFEAARTQQSQGRKDAPLVTERVGAPRKVQVGDQVVGGGSGVWMAGPCAVEDEASLDRVAGRLKELGVTFLRAGAFKPRKSPYTFQGLGMAGIEMLARVGKAHGLKVVSELTNVDCLDEFVKLVDVIQVGANNMFNTDLLKRLAKTSQPVLLKRHFSARVEEWLLAAEYLYAGGNSNVILCERGIRTFETSTRFSLDISAVGLAKASTDLPVIVDVSHAAGRRDLLSPLAKAAMAAGADGLMVEVHERPEVALSDGAQQLGLPEFETLFASLEAFMECSQ